MKLSTRGDYATRVLLELCASKANEPMSVVELASRTAISPKYLEHIIGQLRAAGIVRSERGIHGGYELTRDPDTLTVGEVIRLMDGPLAPSPCASRSAHVPCPAYRCAAEDSCVMRGLWLEVRDAIAGVLDNTTFGDLARRQEVALASARSMYHI